MTWTPMKCRQLDGRTYSVLTIANIEDHVNNIAFEENMPREAHLEALYNGWRNQASLLHRHIRDLVETDRKREYAAAWVARWMEADE